MQTDDIDAYLVASAPTRRRRTATSTRTRTQRYSNNNHNQHMQPRAPLGVISGAVANATMAPDSQVTCPDGEILPGEVTVDNLGSVHMVAW